jgi:hypothetical protein
MIGSASARATSGFSGSGADGGGAGGSEKCAFRSVFDLIGDGRDLSDDFGSFAGSILPFNMFSMACRARSRSLDCCSAYLSSA